ncbi:CAP domain-containing protein [Candidatus Parcubacteria bacterium]|nr:MAG: CAP domain-containing protein [Candidatus Parcubacteria bacterium]
MKKYLGAFLILMVLVMVATSRLWRGFFFAASSEERTLQVMQPIAEKLSQYGEQIKARIFTPPPLRHEASVPRAASLSREGIITLTNTYRRNAGRTPLREEPLLDRAAEMKLEDMFRRQYFAHRNPDGKGPAEVIAAAGYEYLMVGENLALGSFRDDADLVGAWMASKGHRENILKEGFQDIGVALRKGIFQGNEVWIAVQEFGTPANVCRAPSRQLKELVSKEEALLKQLQGKADALKYILDTSHPSGQEEIAAYNENVRRYNSFAREINSLVAKLRQHIADYNDQVAQYNDCLRRYEGELEN